MVEHQAGCVITARNPVINTITNTITNTAYETFEKRTESELDCVYEDVIATKRWGQGSDERYTEVGYADVTHSPPCDTALYDAVCN